MVGPKNTHFNLDKNLQESCILPIKQRVDRGLEKTASERVEGLFIMNIQEL